jgi:hypothetical protein
LFLGESSDIYKILFKDLLYKKFGAGDEKYLGKKSPTSPGFVCFFSFFGRAPISERKYCTPKLH